MRFMVMIKANEDSEAGILPGEEILAAMGQFNEELVNAGVLLAGEGLHPSSRGTRLVFDNGETRVVDGPFAETKELIAGFWLLQVKSKGEAIEWMKRVPHPGPGEGQMEIEIRQIFEEDDFGEAFTPELRAQEQQIRERIEQQGRQA